MAKKKQKNPNGSLFGNLLRKVASSATGGILGNGDMLRKRNAKIEEEESTKGLETVAEREKRIAAEMMKSATDNLPVKAPNISAMIADTKPLDLSGLVKLPIIEHGADKNTSAILWVALGVGALFIIGSLAKK